MQQIHTALFDNNPRAAYEALFAGNPLFISKASKTPDSLLQLPFVQPTDMSIEGGATMNTDFKLFMQMIEKDWGSSISRYANLNMNSLAVYSKICESIGLCTRRQNGKRISKASHSSQQVGKLLRSYNQSAISTA